MGNLIDGKYGTSDYNKIGQDFMLGFFSDLAGGAVGDLASRYSIPKIGKGLLNKFGVHYKTVTSWLGGGLKNIPITLNTSAGWISSVREMTGFTPGKVCVIGRNMSDRVKPFANATQGSIIFDRTNPVAASFFNSDVINDIDRLNQLYPNGWPYNVAKNSLLYKANKEFIKKLKSEGYTFIDLGHGGFPPGTSAFYDLELEEIFY